MSGDYHGSRLTQDERRAKTWRALWRFHFSRRIRPNATVLDLGAGYGDFINSVTAAKRIAIDTWPGLADHVAPGVETIIGPVSDLSAVADGSVDFAFASNLFEHLTQDELIAVLAQLRNKLRPTGQLSILQPNYRYAYREYWDDYTHRTAYSHISLVDLLRAEGWVVIDVAPRFLPLTIKSRLPTWDWLIGLYLRLPFKPMGKQMLVSARAS
ncbi:MAG: class I SAM-dependent methyltransferase [Sphingomonas sp.]|nr:class I SAM-dependent methyltransferase [Sphingomonas sp.]